MGRPRNSGFGLVSALSVLALLLAACGGDEPEASDTGEAEDVVDDDGAADAEDADADDAGDADADDAGDAAAADVEALEIEVATWGSPDHDAIVSFLPVFEEQLDELSNGAITIEHFSGGALAEDTDMPVAVPAGTVQMAWTTFNGWTGVVDETRIFDSPALQVTPEDLNDALADEDGLGGVLAESFREAGAEVLAYAPLGPAVIIGDSEIRTPDDLAGKNVRVYSEGGANIVDSAGGAPTNIAFAEVYTAIQRGTVEAAHVGLQGVASQQLQEVATHGIVPANFFGTAMTGWAANLDWWEGLSDQQREIIREAARTAELESQEHLAAVREELIGQYAEQGLDVYVLDQGDEFYDEWAALVDDMVQEDRDSFDPELVEAIDEAGS